MATYKILYWQEIPTQIKADDGADEVALAMPSRFMERIDELALKRGLHNSDDYLIQWSWSEEQDREGTAAEVAATVMAELEANFTW
jgi:hypothetical protein